MPVGMVVGTMRLDTHSVMTLEEFYEAKGETLAADHVRVWVEGRVSGQRVRFSVECPPSFGPRAEAYLRRVAKRQGFAMSPRTETVMTAGSAWQDGDGDE